MKCSETKKYDFYPRGTILMEIEGKEPEVRKMIDAMNEQGWGISHMLQAEDDLIDGIVSISCAICRMERLDFLLDYRNAKALLKNK